MSVIRMTPEEYEARQRRNKAMSGRECPERPTRKYRNQPQQVGDEKYRSKKELRRHRELCEQEKNGSIRGIRREVAYILAPAVTINGRKRPPLRYMADFVFEELTPGGWREVVEDAKGFRTDGYRVKRHLMLSVHNIAIRET